MMVICVPRSQTWTEHKKSCPEVTGDERFTKAVAQVFLSSLNRPSYSEAARTQKSRTNVGFPSSTSAFCKLKQWKIKHIQTDY